MRIPLTHYGCREIGLFGGACLVLAVVSAFFWWWLSAIFVALSLFVLYFFRDPEREIPAGANLLVSPADGRITDISEVDEPLLGGKAQRVSIFLSVFNVHVNRAPAAGTVISTAHQAGRFMNAMNPESARANEQNVVVMESSELPGMKFVVKQVAGLIARRIVCAVGPGTTLARGERFGMIKFGSRTDVLVPAGRLVDIRVKVGDAVAGGRTVIGGLR